MTRSDLKFGAFLKHELFIFSEKSRISQHIIFQGIIQLLLLGLFFILIMKKRMKYALPGILILVCIDMIAATRLNGPYSVYYHQYRSKEIYTHANQFPKGFPVPGNGRIIDNKDQVGLMFQALWRNLNIFHKQVSYEGYNPLHLKGFEDLADNHAKLYETILLNPLVYQADQIRELDSLSVDERRGIFDSRQIYLDRKDYASLDGSGLRASPGDRVSISKFSPVEIQARSISQGKVLVNLLQNNYHGWTATIDGTPAKILTANMSFISVVVPPGEHVVIFSYEPTDVRWGFYLTVLAIIAGLAILRGTLQGL
jgi:hypothetical protein